MRSEKIVETREDVATMFFGSDRIVSVRFDAVAGKVSKAIHIDLSAVCECCNVDSTAAANSRNIRSEIRISVKQTATEVQPPIVCKIMHASPEKTKSLGK